MTKTAQTHEHTESEPKKRGCCGDNAAKGGKTPALQEQANSRGDVEPKRSHDSESGSCCCGSDKAKK